MILVIIYIMIAYGAIYQGSLWLLRMKEKLPAFLVLLLTWIVTILGFVGFVALAPVTFPYSISKNWNRNRGLSITAIIVVTIAVIVVGSCIYFTYH